jgi:hypothetical protein
MNRELIRDLIPVTGIAVGLVTLGAAFLDAHEEGDFRQELNHNPEISRLSVVAEDLNTAAIRLSYIPASHGTRQMYTGSDQVGNQSYITVADDSPERCPNPQEAKKLVQDAVEKAKPDDINNLLDVTAKLPDIDKLCVGNETFKAERDPIQLVGQEYSQKAKQLRDTLEAAHEAKYPMNSNNRIFIFSIVFATSTVLGLFGMYQNSLH